MTARRDRSQSTTAATETAAPQGTGMNLSELKEKNIPDLNAIAREMNVQAMAGSASRS